MSIVKIISLAKVSFFCSDMSYHINQSLFTQVSQQSDITLFIFCSVCCD